VRLAEGDRAPERLPGGPGRSLRGHSPRIRFAARTLADLVQEDAGEEVAEHIVLWANPEWFRSISEDQYRYAGRADESFVM